MATTPIEIILNSTENNSFFIIGEVIRALDKVGYKSAREEFLTRASKCTDLTDLLKTSSNYVKIKIK